MIALRLILSVAYISGAYYFQYKCGASYPAITPLLISFRWLHVIIKLLFITQGFSLESQAIKFFVEFIATLIFVPDAIFVAVGTMVFMSIGNSFATAEMYSTMATGHGIMDIRRALDKSISDTNRND